MVTNGQGYCKDDATESDIEEATKVKLYNTIKYKFSDNIETIKDDEECPYNPENY